MDAIDPAGGDEEEQQRIEGTGLRLHHVQFRFVPRLDRPPEMPMAGASKWSDTLAWIGAGEVTSANSEFKRPSDRESVRAELRLSEKATRADIRRIRRQFAIRNHPDMLDASEREEATQRMTIANMLLDEALKRLG
jgi:hypothetical protein